MRQRKASCLLVCQAKSVLNDRKGTTVVSQIDVFINKFASVRLVRKDVEGSPNIFAIHP